MENNHRRILWITQTAVLIALLVALQWATAGTSAFAGQYITGSCVNAVLAVAALAAGLWSGVVVALLSPFFAFLLGIGPQLIQVVPAIALGNLTYVLVLYFVLGRKKSSPVWKELLGLLCASAAKALILYLAVVKVMLSVMGPSLPVKQVQTFTAMFSWPQMITALIGGLVALLIVPPLKKALSARSR